MSMFSRDWCAHSRCQLLQVEDTEEDGKKEAMMKKSDLKNEMGVQYGNSFTPTCSLQRIEASRH